MKQSPIFSKTYDLVAWIIPVTIQFPRQQRFVMAAALQREALRFQELLIEAVHHPNPDSSLRAADAELDKLRTHLRLSLEMRLIKPGQYEHAARMTTEIGKLLGGWKSTQAARGRQTPSAGSQLWGRAVGCAAARGTIIIGTPAVRTATGTYPTTSITTLGFGWFPMTLTCRPVKPGIAEIQDEAHGWSGERCLPAGHSQRRPSLAGWFYPRQPNIKRACALW